MRKGLGFHNRHSAGGFQPISLFTGGVQGAWYDPSDSGPTGTGGVGTLFSDRAGTTPCGTPGGGSVVPVGLMLDKSQGLVLGSELITNGNFSNGTTGWTAGANNTLTNDAGRGKCVSSVANGAFFGQSFSAVAGTTYKFVWSAISDGTSVAPAAGLGTILGNSDRFTQTQTGGYAFGVNRAFYYTATANETLWFWFYGNVGQPIGNYILVDDVSIRALSGNHAIAANDTTARPELRARVNLLTYSEDFSQGVWVGATSAGSVTKATTTGTRPDGTTGVIHTLTFPTVSAGGWAFLYQNVGQTLLNIQVTQAIYVRVSSGTATVYLNLQDMSAGPSGGNFVAGSAETVTTSWKRIFLTGTRTVVSGNTSYTVGFDTRCAAGQTNAAPVTIEVWGADLRPANIGTTIPAYQRIADQYTYDAVGFPRRLVANGTSTLMTHGFGINANVTLMAAARRTGGPGQQGLFGATPPSTRLVGLLTANAVNPNWGTYAGAAFQSSGQSILETSAVISNVAEPSLPSQKLYTNQSLSATITGALYGGDSLERRIIFADSTAPISLPFAGNLYGIIAVAKILTDGERTSAVTWLGNKMGQTI